jgi:hypothetical protein
VSIGRNIGVLIWAFLTEANCGKSVPRLGSPEGFKFHSRKGDHQFQVIMK